MSRPHWYHAFSKRSSALLINFVQQRKWSVPATHTCHGNLRLAPNLGDFAAHVDQESVTLHTHVGVAYIDVSIQAPYAAATSVSTAATSVTVRPCFAVNFSWLVSLAGGNAHRRGRQCTHVCVEFWHRGVRHNHDGFDSLTMVTGVRICALGGQLSATQDGCDGGISRGR